MLLISIMKPDLWCHLPLMASYFLFAHYTSLSGQEPWQLEQYISCRDILPALFWTFICKDFPVICTVLYYFVSWYTTLILFVKINATFDTNACKIPKSIVSLFIEMVKELFYTNIYGSRDFQPKRSIKGFILLRPYRHGQSRLQHMFLMWQLWQHCIHRNTFHLMQFTILIRNVKKILFSAVKSFIYILKKNSDKSIILH